MLPFVSVIVPVRNDPRIRRCLRALLGQTYPADRTELIVVDNRSSDETPAVVRQHPVTLLVENRTLSPYAARNRGIESARGEILAFTDADCVPDKHWLARAVAALEREGADLVGGRVRFRYSEPPHAAEIFDSLHNLDNDRSIAERGVAKTGNLCARRRVFEAIGPFPAARRSGGDVEWTGRASGAGFALIYAADALVAKPARRLGPLLKKLYRVGRGQLLLWHEQGEEARVVLPRIARCFRPTRPSALRALLRERGPAGSERQLFAVWITSWLCSASQGAGRLHEWLRTAVSRR